MATFVKTLQTPPLSLQSLATDTSVRSSVLTINTGLAATYFMRVGRNDTTTFTPRGVRFFVQAAGSDSTTTNWFTVAEYETELGSSVASTTVSTGAGGSSTIDVPSASNIAAGDSLFVRNSTLASSEFVRVTKVNSTTLTLADVLDGGQGSSTVTGKAESFVCTIDTAAIRRLSVLVMNNTGRTVYPEVRLITADSIG